MKDATVADLRRALALRPNPAPVASTAPEMLAIGFRDDVGLRWFLHRGAGPGNLMRTLDPLHARHWTSAAELVLWFEALPATSLAQLAGRTLDVLPLAVAVGPPARVLAILPATPQPDAAPGDAPLRQVSLLPS
jgi:hypothetical protein